jgi:RNA polymerase primary sigma factor
MRQFKVTSRTTPHAELGKYMNDIRPLKHMSHAEEAELLRDFDNDPEAAREKLVTSNLHFAVSIAKFYLNHNVRLSDLIQEGNEGLIFAAQRFDPTKGVRFISFAVWWIRQRISAYIQDKGNLIYCPMHPQRHNQQIKALKTKGEYLTDEELCERLGITETELRNSVAANYTIFEIDRPIDETESEECYELQGDIDIDAERNEEYTKTLVKKGLSVLSERDAEIIKRYFGIGYYTPQFLNDIAKDMNLTRSRIQQIVDKSLIKMRSTMQRVAQL